jgi:hypothetical protein
MLINITMEVYALLSWYEMDGHSTVLHEAVMGYPPALLYLLQLAYLDSNKILVLHNKVTH